MTLHVDGARIANAAAYLDVPLRAMTTDAGVDVLSLGATKNGVMFGEAVVVLRPDIAPGLEYLRKIDMQLASKLRFVSAQLLALFETDLWLRSAQHANAMAARLLAGVESIDGVRVTQPTQSNAVFAALAPGAADRLRASYHFYDWIGGEVRWMCAFDTTAADVDGFIAALRAAVQAATTAVPRVLERQPWRSNRAVSAGGAGRAVCRRSCGVGWGRRATRDHGGRVRHELSELGLEPRAG